MSEPNNLTGYQGGDDASGKGGRARQKAIDSQVDDATSGGPAHPAATPSTPDTSGVKAHPASYAPSGDTGPRVYGSPIEGNAPAS